MLPELAAKEKPAMHVVGDVGGRIAIMVDDMLGNYKYVVFSLTNFLEFNKITLF
jgi:phosphoribosylpyrophosphate synthetase